MQRTFTAPLLAKRARSPPGPAGGEPGAKRQRTGRSLLLTRLCQDALALVAAFVPLASLPGLRAVCHTLEGLPALGLVRDGGGVKRLRIRLHADRLDGAALLPGATLPLPGWAVLAPRTLAETAVRVSVVKFRGVLDNRQLRDLLDSVLLAYRDAGSLTVLVCGSVAAPAAVMPPLPLAAGQPQPRIVVDQETWNRFGAADADRFAHVTTHMGTCMLPSRTPEDAGLPPVDYIARAVARHAPDTFQLLTRLPLGFLRLAPGEAEDEAAVAAAEARAFRQVLAALPPTTALWADMWFVHGDAESAVSGARLLLPRAARAVHVRNAAALRLVAEHHCPDTLRSVALDSDTSNGGFFLATQPTQTAREVLAVLAACRFPRVERLSFACIRWPDGAPSRPRSRRRCVRACHIMRCFPAVTHVTLTGVGAGEPAEDHDRRVDMLLPPRVELVCVLADDPALYEAVACAAVLRVQLCLPPFRRVDVPRITPLGLLDALRLPGMPPLGAVSAMSPSGPIVIGGPAARLMTRTRPGNAGVVCIGARWERTALLADLRAANPDLTVVVVDVLD